ncbi:odorant receptor 74a-like [Eupeodes corollae]|uniref:odorant receptor 74a-like n=1 Tax=Eupeodes corollae TaxID=290404 RepID=UPI0024928193|nr:odorant receptor 74a-like [Eupeodes corollae]
MYYQPTLPDGKPITLPWQLRSFFSNVLWPLQDNPTPKMKRIDNIFVGFTFFSFLLAVEAATVFFINNLSDIFLSTEAFSNLVTYNDVILRLFNMAWQKNALKKLLKKFYAEIYVDEKENSEIHKKVQKTIGPINIYAWVYITSFLTFVIGPIIAAFLYNTRLLPHKLEFHFSLENPFVYAWIMAQLTYNGLCASLFVGGEICLLGNFVGYLCARFEIMQEELEEIDDFLISVNDSSKLAGRFLKVVDKCISRTNKLIEFAEEIQKVFSFQFFVMTAHSTLMLCVVIFQTSILDFGSAKFISYVLWMVAKVFELIILGGLGSRLITTTNNISSMFYHCNWEQIVFRSTNRKDNIILMKKINAAILIYHNQIKLNGFGFFSISLEQAASLIQGAGSYFTVLQTFS